VGSKVGKGGGYYLIRRPDQITLVEVIRAADGPVALLPCVSKKFYEPCRICPYQEVRCGLRHLFLDVRDATLKVLEGKTIQDIISDTKASAKAKPSRKTVRKR
jgi:Rrf2 family protein